MQMVNILDWIIQSDSWKLLAEHGSKIVMLYLGTCPLLRLLFGSTYSA
jgi:hypothetical protein